jgi:hypothetical protein
MRVVVAGELSQGDGEGEREPEVDHALTAFGAPAQLAVVVRLGVDRDRAFAVLLGTVDGAWTGGLAAAGRW